MTRTLRAALAGCAALALVGPLVPQALAQAVGNPAWPQATSDVKPEAAARFGLLPNGMRYVIMHNASPAHQTSIRLRIGSGSLEEKDDQQGLAHFIEHMAFKGSAHVPEGEMVKLLQRHGLAFGPDTNASTGFSQTLYMLDLPQSDADSVDLGLMLMRETGSELTLDARSMEPERGVVLSEERLRDTPGYEAGRKRQAFVMKDQLAAIRSPIGKVAVLQHAPVSTLRAYYEANYRPERATLIVVGDIDVDATEAKIKARFSDWRGKGPATAEPVYGVVQPRGLEALVITQAGVTPGVTVDWTRPHDPSPESRAKDRRDTLESLGLSIVNRRMERLAQGENPPFLNASVGRSDQLRSIKEAALSVTPKGDDWQSALTAADGVRRQALQFGVSQAELDRAINESRTRLRNQVASAATRTTPRLAQEIARAVDEDEVFSSPAEDLAIFEESVRGLSVEQVNTALREIFTGNGPLLTMTTPTPLAGGEAALIAGWKAAEAAPVQQATAEATKAWPYTSFGAPGHVVDRKDVADLGVTYVRFANGVRLAFKHTDSAKDQVSVTFNLPGGLLALSKTHVTPTWASGVLTAGGLKQITAEEAQQAWAGKARAPDARIGEEEFSLGGGGGGGFGGGGGGRRGGGGGGGSRAEDIDLQLQVMTAYLTDAAWRPAPLERVRTIAGRGLDQLGSTPQGVLQRHLNALTHPGDARFDAPTREQIDHTTIADVRAIWDRALQGPVDVVIVGDISLDRAIDAVSKTVGALPQRSPATPLPAGAREVHFPAGVAQPVNLTHQGRADQSIGYIAWPTTDRFADPKESAAVNLAVAVLQDRMIAKVRIAEGATYSPSAGSRESETFPGYGVITASVETPPTKLTSFFADVFAIAADLREHPVTADELERAKKPRIEQTLRQPETNAYWERLLTGSRDDPRKLDIARHEVEMYQAVTIPDIQAAARKYLRDDKAFRLTVTPGEGASAAPH